MTDLSDHDRAVIAQMQADTILKQTQNFWEPWKVFAALISAAAVFMVAGATLYGLGAHSVTVTHTEHR